MCGAGTDIGISRKGLATIFLYKLLFCCYCKQ